LACPGNGHATARRPAGTDANSLARQSVSAGMTRPESPNPFAPAPIAAGGGRRSVVGCRRNTV